jgi:hypothetical protein
VWPLLFVFMRVAPPKCRQFREHTIRRTIIQVLVTCLRWKKQTSAVDHYQAHRSALRLRSPFVADIGEQTLEAAWLNRTTVDIGVTSLALAPLSPPSKGKILQPVYESGTGGKSGLNRGHESQCSDQYSLA